MSAPQSPCTGVCKLNRERICIGCGRNLDEIAQWAAASDTRRQAIVVAARARRAGMKAIRAP